MGKPRKIIRWEHLSIASAMDYKPTMEQIGRILSESPDVAIYTENSPLLIFKNGEFSHVGPFWHHKSNVAMTEKDCIAFAVFLKLKRFRLTDAVKEAYPWEYGVTDIHKNYDGHTSRSPADGYKPYSLKNKYVTTINNALIRLEGIVEKKGYVYRLETTRQNKDENI